MSIGYLQEQLGVNERILVTSRQHWFYLVKRLFWAAVAFVGIVVFVYLLHRWSPEQALFDWFYLALLVPGVILVWRALGWRNKVYAVTNRRVARVAGVLTKNVKDSSLEKVNDVVLHQGVIGRVFGYGSIRILTAAEFGMNHMTMIPHPVEFKKAMQEAKEQYEHQVGRSG